MVPGENCKEIRLWNYNSEKTKHEKVSSRKEPSHSFHKTPSIAHAVPRVDMHLLGNNWFGSQDLHDPWR